MVPAVVAVAAIVAVAIVAFPRHHKPESAQRAAVSLYITRVDAIEQQMTYALSQVARAYREFTTSRSLSPATARGLAQAERTLVSLHTRLGRVVAPPQAERLRTLVVKLVGQETEITHEVDGLVHFTPAFRSAVSRLQSAATVLSHRLSAAQAPKPRSLRGTPAQIKKAQAAYTAAANAAAAAQADAVVAYDDALSTIVRRLRKLSPPPVFAPAYHAQLVALEDTVTAGARLAAELRNPKRTHVTELSRAFTVATRRAQSTSSQRAEIAAVVAYNRRVRAVGQTAAAVRNELSRLQRTLP